MSIEINYDTANEELLRRAIESTPSAAVAALLGNALTTLHEYPGLVRSPSFRRLCMDSAHDAHVWLVDGALAIARETLGEPLDTTTEIR